MANSNQDLGKQLEQALNNPEIQKIYANGFVNAMGTEDIVVLLKNSEGESR